MSSLQTLSVRKLPPLTDKSTDDEHDRCKLITTILNFFSATKGTIKYFVFMTDSRFCYGLMQLTTLTELDLSQNPIPTEMQINLQVRMHSQDNFTSVHNHQYSIIIIAVESTKLEEAFT